MPARSDSARRRSAAVAGHVGDRATAHAAVRDPVASVRIAALRSLERLGELDDATRRAALGDPDPAVRIAALELAAHHPTPPVGGLLGDDDPMVAEAACWVLGERGTDTADLRVTEGPDVIRELSRVATGHDDPLVREAAVAALGAIGDDEGRAAVLAATGDKPAVRRRAVLALVAFEGPDVDAAWARARHDRDRQVRDAVEELLGPVVGDASTSVSDDPRRP